jgi:hypothetical protein
MILEDVIELDAAFNGIVASGIERYAAFVPSMSFRAAGSTA